MQPARPRRRIHQDALRASSRAAPHRAATSPLLNLQSVVNQPLFLSIIENCVANFSSPSGLPVRLPLERHRPDRQRADRNRNNLRNDLLNPLQTSLPIYSVTRQTFSAPPPDSR